MFSILMFSAVLAPESSTKPEARSTQSENQVQMRRGWRLREGGEQSRRLQEEKQRPEGWKLETPEAGVEKMEVETSYSGVFSKRVPVASGTDSSMLWRHLLAVFVGVMNDHNPSGLVVRTR